MNIERDITGKNFFVDTSALAMETSPQNSTFVDSFLTNLFSNSSGSFSRWGGNKIEIQATLRDANLTSALRTPIATILRNQREFYKQEGDGDDDFIVRKRVTNSIHNITFKSRKHNLLSQKPQSDQALALNSSQFDCEDQATATFE